MPTPLSILEDATEFHARHIGPDAVDESLMCAAIGVPVRSHTLVWTWTSAAMRPWELSAW